MDNYFLGNNNLDSNPVSFDHCFPLDQALWPVFNLVKSFTFLTRPEVSQEKTERVRLVMNDWSVKSIFLTLEFHSKETLAKVKRCTPQQFLNGHIPVSLKFLFT